MPLIANSVISQLDEISRGKKLPSKIAELGKRAATLVGAPQISELNAAAGNSRRQVLAKLLQAKAHSDRKRYAAKHQILRELMQSDPASWSIDDDTGPYKGVTHVPTNFRLHAPPAIIPSSVKAASFDKLKLSLVGNEIPLAFALGGAGLGGLSAYYLGAPDAASGEEDTTAAKVDRVLFGGLGGAALGLGAGTLLGYPLNLLKPAVGDGPAAVSAKDYMPAGYEKDLAKARQFRKENPDLPFWVDISESGVTRKVPAYTQDPKDPRSLVSGRVQGIYMGGVPGEFVVTKPNPRSDAATRQVMRHELTHARQNLRRFGAGPVAQQDVVPGVVRRRAADSAMRIEQEAILSEFKQYLRENKPELLDGDKLDRATFLRELSRYYLKYPVAYIGDLLDSPESAKQHVFEKMWPGIAQNYRPGLAGELGKQAAIISSQTKQAGANSRRYLKTLNAIHKVIKSKAGEATANEFVRAAANRGDLSLKLPLQLNTARDIASQQSRKGFIRNTEKYNSRGVPASQDEAIRDTLAEVARRATSATNGVPFLTKQLISQFRAREAKVKGISAKYDSLARYSPTLANIVYGNVGTQRAMLADDKVSLLQRLQSDRAKNTLVRQSKQIAPELEKATRSFLHRYDPRHLSPEMLDGEVITNNVEALRAAVGRVARLTDPNHRYRTVDVEALHYLHRRPKGGGYERHELLRPNAPVWYAGRPEYSVPYAIRQHKPLFMSIAEDKLKQFGPLGPLHPHLQTDTRHMTPKQVADMATARISTTSWPGWDQPDYEQVATMPSDLLGYLSAHNLFRLNPRDATQLQQLNPRALGAEFAPAASRKSVGPGQQTTAASSLGKQAAELTGPYRDRVEVFALDPLGKVYGGRWKDDKTFAVPGGGIDEGEDVAEAAAREFREETGLDVHNVRSVGIPDTVSPWSEEYRKSRPADRRHFVGNRTKFMVGDLLSTTPAAGKLDKWDAEDRRQYTVQEALKLMSAGNKPYHEPRRQLLQKLFDQSQGPVTVLAKAAAAAS